MAGDSSPLDWQRRCVACVRSGGVGREACELLADVRGHLGPQAPCPYRAVVLGDLQKVADGDGRPLTFAPVIYRDVRRGETRALLRKG